MNEVRAAASSVSSELRSLTKRLPTDEKDAALRAFCAASYLRACNRGVRASGKCMQRWGGGQREMHARLGCALVLEELAHQLDRRALARQLREPLLLERVVVLLDDDVLDAVDDALPQVEVRKCELLQLLALPLVASRLAPLSFLIPRLLSGLSLLSSTPVLHSC